MTFDISFIVNCVYGWAGVCYVITKFSQMDRLPNFVTHGAPLRMPRVRKSSAIKKRLLLNARLTVCLLRLESARMESDNFHTFSLVEKAHMTIKRKTCMC